MFSAARHTYMLTVKQPRSRAVANHFRVTVSRINESANKDPYMTMEGLSLTVRPDGGLSIESDVGGHSFSAGTLGRL